MFTEVEAAFAALLEAVPSTPVNSQLGRIHSPTDADLFPQSDQSLPTAYSLLGKRLREDISTDLRFSQEEDIPPPESIVARDFGILQPGTGVGPKAVISGTAHPPRYRLNHLLLARTPALKTAVLSQISLANQALHKRHSEELAQKKQKLLQRVRFALRLRKEISLRRREIVAATTHYLEDTMATARQGKRTVDTKWWADTFEGLAMNLPPEMRSAVGRPVSLAWLANRLVILNELERLDNPVFDSVRSSFIRGKR